jgi:CubicO group peptidase (beta-lactamase class C family)
MDINRYSRMDLRPPVSYPKLLDCDLFDRVGMTSSVAPLSATIWPECTDGVERQRQREEAWTMNAYAPAGGVRSTPEDMARYARALLDRRAPGLGALERRWDADNGTESAMPGSPIESTARTSRGATAQQGAFQACLPSIDVKVAAVVILANTVAALDEVAMNVLLGTN